MFRLSIVHERIPIEAVPKFSIKTQRCQIIVLMSTLILPIGTGLHSGWPTPAIPKLLQNEIMGITEKQVSYLVTVYPLAYLVADPISAWLLDQIGRKMFLLLLAMLDITAWIIIANSTKVWMAFGGRFLAGMTEGASYIGLPVYICEITEANIRGRSGMAYSSAFVFGILLINTYGSYISLRMSAYLSLFVPLLFLITFIWMPESPYFYLMKGNTEDARLVLRKLRNNEDVDAELMKIAMVIQQQLAESSGIKDVFMVKSNFKAFIILIGLRTFQQLTGGWAIVYYNQIIFQVAEGSVSSSLSSIIFDFALFLCSFSGVLLIDKFGRRPLLLTSSVLTSTCLFFQAVYFTFLHLKYDLKSWKWFPLTGMVMYNIARGFGIMAIPTLMSGELFPANIKVKAIGLANIYKALVIGGMSKLFYISGDTYGMHIPFYLFVVTSVVGIVVIYLYVPETKGKTLEEIQEASRGVPYRYRQDDELPRGRASRHVTDFSDYHYE